ncbi:MAG: TIGR04282 family arsenosugar biosynthesis glycosyltransferase [Maribacter sp.]|nr:TIGR04282 family arsenosugar biosynthesis glycosyltransferase [Maribacter sp.]
MGILQNMGEEQDEKVIHFNLVDSTDLLLIFTRNPELGQVKTRLAADIGDKNALEIYRFLVGHTADITRDLAVHKRVYYSEEIWKDDIWDTVNFHKRLQHGKNLGERMGNAFHEGFADGFTKICIIGSDLYDLSQKDIRNAFTALDQNDVVIGPAADGGYYLLGMKKWNGEVFKNKKWGTDTVLEETLADLLNEKVTLLDVRNDIDIYEDIKDIQAFRPFLKNL